MEMKAVSLPAVTLKTTIVHTVTYFIVGILSVPFLNYEAKFANPAVAVAFRQMDDPFIAAGPMLQVLRGFLFGIAFYSMQETFVARRRGWLNAWLVLLIAGVFSTFGAAPGSIEGLVYSTLPVWFQLITLPELIIQSLLLALLTHYWIRHPEKKWLGWSLGIAAMLVVFFSILGTLAAMGILTQPV